MRMPMEMGEAYIGTWQAGREAGVIDGFRAPHHTVSYGAHKGTGEIARVREMEDGTLILQEVSNWHESLLTAIGREFRRGGFNLYITVRNTTVRRGFVGAVSDMLTHLGLEVPEDRAYGSDEVLRVGVA